MTTKSVLFGARRGTVLGERGVAGLGLPKSVASRNLNKVGMRRMPVTIPLVSPLVRNSMSRLRRGFIPFAILSAWFALSPPARAADGGLGNGNTAEGDLALQNLSTGANNTALGFGALFNNTTSSQNTATGSFALLNNMQGVNNTATGAIALFSNTTGFANTANGVDALRFNTTGNFNTADGINALKTNTTGSFNTALGRNAGFALTTGNNNIDIGNVGVAGESNKIRIGTLGTQNATFIAGIRGATVASGVGVIVGTDGQLGTVISSERFKKAIKPMDKASEVILALKPVTFRYKHELDPAGIPQFGLAAEQVAKVSPDLVARDDQGKVNTVRFEAVNAMLLNEFLKEHREVQELEAAIARQQKNFAQQQKVIKALAASLKEQALEIQKVSGWLGVSKSAGETAAGG